MLSACKVWPSCVEWAMQWTSWCHECCISGSVAFGGCMMDERASVQLSVFSCALTHQCCFRRLMLCRTFCIRLKIHSNSTLLHCYTKCQCCANVPVLNWNGNVLWAQGHSLKFKRVWRRGGGMFCRENTTACEAETTEHKRGRIPLRQRMREAANRNKLTTIKQGWTWN